MADRYPLLITDNRFQSALSCPLKLAHIYMRREKSEDRLPFHQRNKLRLRDLFASSLPDLKQTSDNTEQAAEETKRLLQDGGNVTILGAVVRSGNFVSRIPILRREGNSFTIWQIHGKLRKRSEPPVIRDCSGRRAEQVYLLKAAYRSEIIRQIWPDSSVSVKLVFPRRGYKAPVSDLAGRISEGAQKQQKLLAEEAEELFVIVDATEGVQQMSRSVSDDVAHSAFRGKSVSGVCELINRPELAEGNAFGVKIHRACGYCKDRQPEREHEKGCWEEWFFDESLSRPERHTFELIGHGNHDEAERGSHYQEQVVPPPKQSTFDEIRLPHSPVISIGQRRLLQLASARDEEIPKLWLKPGVKELADLEYPMHFIDFEAATYAIPMMSGREPYSPLLFQFSSHTLYEGGRVNHHFWLEEGAGGDRQHHRFTEALLSVPDISHGTLIQYSPFEAQALNRLVRELRRVGGKARALSDELQKLVSGGKRGHSRLFDISRTLRDYYYNHRFEGSLGLKESLQNILMWEKKHCPKKSMEIELAGMKVDLLADVNGNGPDPYRQIQHPNLRIDEGVVAMHAYIALRNGLLSSDEQKLVPELLNRYCSLDTCALLIIWNHLAELSKQVGDDDLVIF